MSDKQNLNAKAQSTQSGAKEFKRLCSRCVLKRSGTAMMPAEQSNIGWVHGHFFDRMNRMHGKGYGVFILSILLKVFFAFLRAFAPLRSVFDFHAIAGARRGFIGAGGRFLA